MSRISWLDEDGGPQIDTLARQLTTFLEAMADGRIDRDELEAQEARVVGLMRELEPLLDDELHQRCVYQAVHGALPGLLKSPERP